MSWAAYRRAQARRAMRSLKGMLDAYRAGDYETALRFIDSMQGNRLIRGSATLRGGMLLNLGRIDEAEQCLREGIALKLDSKRMALAYSSLGQLLLERKRYNEAMQCFQTSLKHWPERGSTHRDIAEACLRRGANTAEAVKWARLAVTEDRATKAASPQAKESADINLGEDLATLAWAVAADSRDRDEVDRLVDEALPLVRNVVPVTARVRCYAGHAYQALGDSRNSEYHFDEAARIDPHGLWGRSARAAATLV
ncbi:MAG TPA: SDR family oxidoreductase [Bryobacteraceae bacterium]|nr:SDR family oxidoreductase [Bryobacteraceae bacterium]